MRSCFKNKTKLCKWCPHPFKSQFWDSENSPVFNLSWQMVGGSPSTLSALWGLRGVVSVLGPSLLFHRELGGWHVCHHNDHGEYQRYMSSVLHEFLSLRSKPGHFSHHPPEEESSDVSRPREPCHHWRTAGRYLRTSLCCVLCWGPVENDCGSQSHPQLRVFSSWE